MKITRLIFTASAVLIFISYLAYAQQSHPADEITPGTFTAGEYIFLGNLTFRNQPSEQITIVPSNDLQPNNPVISIMDSSESMNLIEFQKGGYIIAQRLGLGLASGETPKYDLDVPQGEIHARNLSLAGYGVGSHTEIGFEGSTAYINAKKNGNIYIGSGIWGNTSNVNIGGNLTIAENVNFGYETISGSCSSCTSNIVWCSAGKRVLGGGCFVFGGPSLVGSVPNGYSSWMCTATGIATQITGYTICARIS